MAIEHAELFAALAAPFAPHEVKVRTQAGRLLHYITARTAMNRLDEVLGPAGWWDSYVPMEHSVLCTLTIRLPDGSTLSKQDAGGYAGMQDQGDDDKSGYSDAFKRAAVKFGVGRYLYRDGVPSFVGLRPEDAPPEGGGVSATGLLPGPRRPLYSEEPAPEGERRRHDGPPRTGPALVAWAKDVGKPHGKDVFAYLARWGKLRDYPARLVDWDADQVANAVQEATRKLRAALSREDAELDAQAARDAGPGRD